MQLVTSPQPPCMQVVEFYSQQARSNNYAYREAVCACLAELAERLDPPAVQPHMPAMLRLLLSLLRDDSWPVRAHLSVSRV